MRSLVGVFAGSTCNLVRNALARLILRNNVTILCWLVLNSAKWYIWAATWEDVPSDLLAKSAVWSVSFVRMCKLSILLSKMHLMKNLIRLRECASLLESSLGTRVKIRFVMLRLFFHMLTVHVAMPVLLHILVRRCYCIYMYNVIVSARTEKND